jgi:uncharacterized membrane protein YfcA
MQIVWCLAVFFFAALVQSVGGFGFALFAVPLMALAIDLPSAVIAASVASLANVLVLAIRSLRDIDRGVTKRLNVPALFGMPIGLYVLIYIDEAVLKVALGVVIMVLIAVLMRTNGEPKSRPLVDVIAGFVAGILATSTSTNGPPLVFAAQLRGLPPAAFRATMSASFVLQGSVSLLLFFVSGVVSRQAVLLAVIGLPLVAIGQWIGVTLRPHVDGRRFTRLVYGLLVLSAASVMWSGLS